MAPIDRIKFDGSSDVLVCKWPSEKIVLGAQLIVNESQEALFYKGGQALDLFGPGTHTLTTANIPLLQKIINLPFGGKTPFTAEVYFVSRAVVPGQHWGTKKPIMLLDPRYRVTIPLRGYGEYAFRVTNSREFVVEIVGTSGGADADDIASTMIESLIVSCIQQAFGEFLVNRQVSALEIPAHTGDVANLASEQLRTRYSTFGIELINFSIESINFDPNDESVKRLRSMLDEAARLDVVGDAFRRNRDFYHSERQFDVLQSAADGDGAAGNLMGAAMGVGMGFGIAGPAMDVAKRSMDQDTQAQKGRCPQCGAAHEAGTKFCSECGQKIATLDSLACSECGTENAPGVKFCNNCGNKMAPATCGSCGAQLNPGSKFCGKCGAKT
mgnify:CR=1 FL=1